MPTLDLHLQRDLKLSGEKGKLKDSLNIIIQKLSCFVISKMVRVKGIFHTLFVILDLRTLSQDISSCIQQRSWKLLRRGSISERCISIFSVELNSVNLQPWGFPLPSRYHLEDSFSPLGTSALLGVTPSACAPQTEKTRVLSNRVGRG